MITINIKEEVIKDEKDQIIFDDDIFKFINENIIFDGEDFNLLDLYVIIKKYPSIIKLYKNLENFVDKAEKAIKDNDARKVSGKICLFEGYNINPIIHNKNYLNEITPYSNISKEYMLFFVNVSGNKEKIEKLEVKYFLGLNIIVKDKRISFNNMFNDSIIVMETNIDITLNDFLLVFDKIKYN